MREETPAFYLTRKIPEGYMISKLDVDFNVESSYIVSESGKECSCPAGQAPKCRHRSTVLPAAKRAKHIGDGWMFAWHTRGWHPSIISDDLPTPEEIEASKEGDSAPEPASPPAPSASEDPSPQPSPFQRRF